MSLLRAFIAVEIPATVQEEIHAAIAGLQKTLGPDLVRWVSARNLHLTLKFLGDISPASVEILQQTLKTEAGQHPPFELRLEGLGAFPNPRRPRVIWIGFAAPPALESLQRGIEAASARLGYEAEERPFSPHLTLGRVKPDLSPAGLQRVRTALEQTQIAGTWTVRIDSVHLFKSDLQPGGSVYTRLFSANLNDSL